MKHRVGLDRRSNERSIHLTQKEHIVTPQPVGSKVALITGANKGIGLEIGRQPGSVDIAGEAVCMRTITLTDAQWQNMLPFVRAGPHIDIGQEGRCRRLLSALGWMARSAAQWRLLPQESGDWTTVSKRLARGRKQGVFEPLPQFCANAPE